MITILHVSDLHFGPHYLPDVGEALIRAAHQLNADIIVNSGDYTQRAKRQQYEAASSFLSRLPEGPSIGVPGNHDVPLYRVHERVLKPYHWYRTFISEQLDDVLRLENAVIVGLNSTSPLRAITNGRISSGQLEFCARAFADAPAGALRAVVAHHHFAPAPDYEGGQVMPGAKRALDAFKRLNVELVFGGHLHRAYIGNSLDVYPGERREQGIIIVQAGTTTSRRGRAREREKNSFNLLVIEDRIIRITHFMYFDDIEGFAPISRHLFPRRGDAHLGGSQVVGAPAARPAEQTTVPAVVPPADQR